MPDTWTYTGKDVCEDCQQRVADYVHNGPLVPSGVVAKLCVVCLKDREEHLNRTGSPKPMFNLKEQSTKFRKYIAGWRAAAAYTPIEEHLVNDPDFSTGWADGMATKKKVYAEARAKYGLHPNHGIVTLESSN